MNERDLMTSEEKSRQIIKTAVTLLTILGLLTAVAVVALNLYKKLKESIRVLNADGVLDPTEVQNYATDPASEGGEHKGCSVNVDPGESA